MRKLAYLAFVFSIFASTANAEVTEEHFVIDTTADLVALCSVSPNDPHTTAAIHMCHGYLTGLVHFHKTMGSSLENKIFCLDEADRPPRNQAVAMLVEWSRAHPEHDGTEAIDGVMLWAADTWPCT